MVSCRGSDHEVIADGLALDESNSSHMEVLNKIKTRFREETFTRESIKDVILNHPELVRMLYINFAMVHCEFGLSV